MENKELQEFLHFHYANLINDNKRCVRRANFRFFTDPANANVIKDSRDFYYREYQDKFDMELDVMHERMVVLELPESCLNHLVHMHRRFYAHSNGGEPMAKAMIEKEWAEHEIRARSPAVQQAWEQYSLLLHLASNGKELS